jgi:hypothetical protein
MYEDNKTNSWCFTLIYHTEKERENNEIARVKQKASQVQETIVIVNAYGFFFLLLTTELVILNKYYNQY